MKDDGLYPSAKPLPKVVRVPPTERLLKGTLRLDVFNRQAFKAMFKKDKAR